MPRTTLDLDPIVVRELRHRGRREGKSMGQVASEVLARAFAEPQEQEPRPPFEWLSRDLGLPLVDLEDEEAIRAAFERDR